MAEDDILDAELFQAGDVALAGESALVLKMDVLRTELDVRALQLRCGSEQADGHRADNDFRLRADLDLLQVFDKGDGLSGRLVHFPVARDHGFSHGGQILSMLRLE